jgi:hypothetical protein
MSLALVWLLQKGEMRLRVIATANLPSSCGRHAWVGGDRRLADLLSRVALADQVATVVSVASWIGVLSLDLRFQLVTPEPENTILILRCETLCKSLFSSSLRQILFRSVGR